MRCKTLATAGNVARLAALLSAAVVGGVVVTARRYERVGYVVVPRGVFDERSQRAPSLDELRQELKTQRDAV